MKNKASGFEHKKGRQRVEISASELIYVLREHELKIHDNSPLAPFRQFSPKGNQKSLDALGFFDEDSGWHNALINVCEPDFQINRTLCLPESIVVSTYCFNRAHSNHLVGCWPQRDKIFLSFPFDAQEIAVEDMRVLGIDYAPPPETSEFLMKLGTLVAFAAAADAVKAVLLTGVMKRQNAENFRLPRDHLNLMRQLSIKDDRVNAHWLVTLLRVVAPDGIELVNREIGQREIADLIELGLVEPETRGYWSPGHDLLKMTSNWITPLPAIYHETVISHLDDTQDVASSLTFRGSGPITLIDFTPEAGADAARVRQLKAGEYWLEMMGRLVPPKAESEYRPQQFAVPDNASDKPVEGTQVCVVCENPLRPGQKFCPNCGAQIIAKPLKVTTASVCPSCGHTLGPRAKFCAHCGAKADTR